MFPIDWMRGTSERKLIGSGWYEAEGEEEMAGFPQEMHYFASRNCGERSPVVEWVRASKELQKAFLDRSILNTS